MKKLFTLSLALLVAMAGYSQVKSNVSKNDARKTVATEKVAIGDEVNQNINMPRINFYGEEELDNSYYDWQTNTAAKNVTMNFPDGCVGFAYTMSTDESHSDRGTAIIIYNPFTEEWTTTGGKIEEEKTGFGCAARYGENGVVVVSRNATTLRCGVYIIEDKDNLPASGTVKPVIEWEKDEHNLHFPTVMCTGPDHKHIHILFTALDEVSADGLTNPYYYFRSMDGGETWDEFMTIEGLGRQYNSNFGSGQEAYFIENNGGNDLEIVVNARRGDGAVLTSHDEGNTWERTVFYKHPGIDVDYGDPSTDGTWYFYPRWTSALRSNQGELQIAYEFGAAMGDPTSTSYYPGVGGVAFWSENMPYQGNEFAPYGYDPNNANPPVNGQPFVMDSAYLFSDIYATWPLFSNATHPNEGMLPEYFGYLCALTDQGDFESWEDATEFNISDRSLHGGYNCGPVAMPILLTTPLQDLLVSVWIAMDENNMDDLGNYYFKMFAAASQDGGLSWTNPIHITNNFLFQYSECAYPQAAITNNQLVVIAQMDPETDNALLGSDPDPSNSYFHGIVFNLSDLFGYDAVEENAVENTTISVYPNPATDNMSVSLSQNETVVISNMMGQVVKSFEGNVGINTVDVSSLSSGVYFISAGSATQKFVVK
jgi:hypothetical protein